ncbi:E3 ubiquitin-protein ligase znrf2-like [Polymixia lowei]
MGAKQSSPVFDVRTRAYSSSDLPSGNSNRADRIAGFRYTNGPDGPRIRYTGGGAESTGLNIPTNGRSGSHGLNQSLDGTMGESDLSLTGHRLLIGSLPAHLSPHMLGGFHCPVCSKYMVSDEMEKHLLACFTKTHLAYNKDILSKDSGECAICLEEMEQGDTIARLPCLCIYHKGCIDEWFEVNRSCPEHPSD